MPRPAPSRFAALLPSGLVGLRVITAPALIGGVALGWPGWLLAVLLAAGFVSDILDGILARHWSIATPRLRRADSTADVGFWLCVLVAAELRVGHLSAPHIVLLVVLLGSEIVCQAISRARFGQPPATHSYAAKLWGILLFLAFAPVLALGRSFIAVDAALAFGLLVNAEVIAIMLLSPVQPVDVASLGPILWRRLVPDGIKNPGLVHSTT